MFFRIFSFMGLTFFGLIFLKIYHDRNKDNIWGNLHRTLVENMNKPEESNSEIILSLGWIAIILGLAMLFFGGLSGGSGSGITRGFGK